MPNHTADQLRTEWPKLVAFINDSETDVLAREDFPAQHRVKIHATNPVERMNKKVKPTPALIEVFPSQIAAEAAWTAATSTGTHIPRR